ncbi:MAG: oligosaccharide flippase family protein [Actinomycetota bacterium]
MARSAAPRCRLLNESPETERAHLSKQAAADIETVAKGGAVQIIGQISARSVTFAFTFVAVRVLGRAAYGLYREVAAVLAIAGQLGLAGFNYASMRFIARSRAARNHGGVRGAAKVGLVGAGVASAVVVIGIVAGADLLAAAFAESPAQESDFARYFRIGAAYVPLFALMQVLRYCTQGYKTMVPSVVAGNIIQPVARFVLGLGVLLAGFEVAGAVTSLVASVGIGALAAALFFRRMLTADERSAAPIAEPGAMVRFALPQGGASLLGIQSLGLGVILLGIASSNVQTALFGIALALQGPGTVFLGGIVNIWAPVVADLHAKGEMERLGSLYQTINRWIATFSFPVFGALILEPDVFVWMIAGGKGEGAAGVVAILAVGNFFYTGTGPTGYIISMTGRPGINLANSVVAVALYAGAGALVVHEHGAVGMAVVDAAVTALVNSARVVEAKILLGVQPFGRSFVKPVIATLVGAAVLLAWRLVPGDDLWLDTVGICVAAAVYLGVLRALGLDAEERHVLDRIKARAFRRGR